MTTTDRTNLSYRLRVAKSDNRHGDVETVWFSTAEKAWEDRELKTENTTSHNATKIARVKFDMARAHYNAVASMRRRQHPNLLNNKKVTAFVDSPDFKIMGFQALKPASGHDFDIDVNGELRCRIENFNGIESSTLVVPMPEAQKLFDVHCKLYEMMQEYRQHIPLKLPVAKVHRYAVGEKLVYASFNFTGPTRFFGARSYHPWEDTLIGVDYKTLTVAGAYDVPGEWSDDPLHRGYVMQEEGSTQLWENQYPRAAYGQISTDNDYYAHRRIPKGIDFKSSSEEEMDLYCNHYEDVTATIDRMMRGVRTLSNPNQRGNPTETDNREDERRARMLREYIDVFIAEIKEKTGATVKLVPYSFDSELERAVLSWESLPQPATV